MKILWYTNTPCLYKQNNAYNGGGWLSSLQTLLMRRSEIELGIAFPLDDEKEKVVEKGVGIVTFTDGVNDVTNVLEHVSVMPAKYIKRLVLDIKNIGASAKNTVCIDLGSGNDACVLTTMYSVLGKEEISLVGGTGDAGKISVNGKIYEDAVAYALVKNLNGKVKVYKENIYRPMDNCRMIASKTDKSKYVIGELNGRPAKQEYMNNEVVNFLKFNQKYWYLMHPEDDDEKIFASPRSWTKCCQMLYNISCGAEEDGWSLDDVPFNRIQEILLQFVQPEVATEFMTYYKLTRAIDIHALHNVFKDPKKAPDLKKGKDGKDLRTDIKYYMVAKVLSGLDTNKMPEPKEMENLAIWLVTSKDESVAAAALHTLFEMFPDIRFQLGNPECQNLSGYETTWNKYIDMTTTLIQGIPGMDKEMDVTL